MWVAFPKDASSPSMGRLGSAHFWKGHPHPGSHTCLQKTSRRHTLRFAGGDGDTFLPGKKMSERSELFFPGRKVSPSPPNSTVRPNTRQPPNSDNPVIALLIQHQINRCPVIASRDFQVHRDLELQLQRVRARRQRHHIHPFNPGFKLLDTLTNRPAYLDTQIMSTQSGIVEIQQPQVGYACAVTRVG